MSSDHGNAVRRRERRLTVRDRFALINRDRLYRARECLNPRQRDFLDLLPLLFHSNHPLLPGYVSKDTPAGIPDYSPAAAALSAARRLSRSFEPGRRAARKTDILGLYFMGSSGTIAHSDQSDFDVWVCHHPQLSPPALTELGQKARAIEQWATTLDLEVHCFVFEAGAFRRGEQLALSSESSGSTQHYLLLDEFYRSGLLVAGLCPLWWVVPTENDGDYDDYISELIRKRALRVEDYIDFGPLHRIPPEEFFGAALWQLYKGIGSPHKSLLKLLLMEVYAGEYPDTELLSQRYKRAVQAGETDVNVLDPYLLLYRRLEEYLTARQEPGRLQLLRRAFYLKVDEALSRPARSQDSLWRRERVTELVRSWGWSEHEVRRLDQKAGWKIDTVLEERRDLVSALTAGYRVLSQFARRLAGDPRISQADLNVLGRRLYAAFERKPGKVDLVNQGIAQDLSEPVLSLHRVPLAGQLENWMLYRDAVPAAELGQRTPLRRAQSIIDLLAWCHFNRMSDSHTRFLVFGADSGISAREAQTLAETLAGLFPLDEFGNASVEDLTRRPRIRRAALFVNIGVEPCSQRARNGQHLTSSRSNALSYGGLRENLAQSFDLLLTTTWDEVYCFRYRDIEGLMQCLCEYLQRILASTAAPPPVTVACLTPGYGIAIKLRMEELFRHLSASFLTAAQPGTGRYLLEASEGWHLLDLAGGQPRHLALPNAGVLMRELAAPTDGFVRTVLDPETLQDTPLPLIFARNRPHAIQIFVLPQPGRDSAEVYVVDEHGSLFQQQAPCPSVPLLVGRYAAFLSAMLNRRACRPPNGAPPPQELALEYHLLRRDPGGGYRARPITPDSEGPGFLDVQVIGTLSERQERLYTIYCGQREFSSLEHGPDLFRATARHILGQRGSGLAYPIFITDIDLADHPSQAGAATGVPTVRHLQYKHSVEERLNRALMEWAPEPALAHGEAEPHTG